MESVKSTCNAGTDQVYGLLSDELFGNHDGMKPNLFLGEPFPIVGHRVLDDPEAGAQSFCVSNMLL